jgi:hypothetical protein
LFQKKERERERHIEAMWKGKVYARSEEGQESEGLGPPTMSAM